MYSEHDAYAQAALRSSQTIEPDSLESWYDIDGSALKSGSTWDAADFARLQASRAFENSDLERDIFGLDGADGSASFRLAESNDDAPQMPNHELSEEPTPDVGFLSARSEAAESTTQAHFTPQTEPSFQATPAQYIDVDGSLQENIAPDPYEHLRPSIVIQTTDREDSTHAPEDSLPDRNLRGDELPTFGAQPSAELNDYKVPDPYAPEPVDEQGSARLDYVDPETYQISDDDASIEQNAPSPPEPEPEPPPGHAPDDELAPTTTRGVIAEEPVLEYYPPEDSTRQDFISGDGFAKLLRRLRRHIDDILKKRIQWQNEQQKLERRRAYYKASIRGMIEVIEAEHPNPEDRDSHKDETPQQEYVPEQRTNPEVDASPTIDRPTSSGSVRGSGAATTSSSNVAADSATSISFKSFRDARRQVKVDEHALVEQEDLMKALVEQINALEYHVQELVQQIVKQMGSATFLDELRIEMLDPEATTQNSDEPRAAPEDDTPELVVQYFDWMGERGINRDRLHELDHTHNEGLVQRDFLRDQGRELDVSDEEYLVNYRSHREDIVLRLNEASDKITFYFKLCEEAGLDPESYRRVAPSQFSADITHASRSKVQLAGQVEEGRSGSPPYDGVKLRIIEEWRRNIALGQSELVAGIAPPVEPLYNLPP